MSFMCHVYLICVPYSSSFDSGLLGGACPYLEVRALPREPRRVRPSPRERKRGRPPHRHRSSFEAHSLIIHLRAEILRVYLTESVYEVVSQKSIPHKSVNLFCVLLVLQIMSRRASQPDQEMCPASGNTENLSLRKCFQRCYAKVNSRPDPTTFSLYV